MKRKYGIIIFLLMIAIISNFTNISIAAPEDEYSFQLEYSGDVILNETKEGRVILRATNGTTFARVQIKVDITGPATPKILATDSSGVEHDIAQLGYWGPENGFAVGGTFENVTPIRATFSEAGTYTIKLSLINLDNNNAVIIERTQTIEVLEDNSNVNEIVNDTNNTTEELPKTGTSVVEYIILIGIITTIIGFGYFKTRKVKQ